MCFSNFRMANFRIVGMGAFSIVQQVGIMYRRNARQEQARRSNVSRRQDSVSSIRG